MIPAPSNGSIARLPYPLLRESLGSLATSQHLAVVVVSETRVLQANDAFLDMIGRSRQELLENAIDWEALTPPEYVAIGNVAVNQLRSFGASLPFEKEYFLPDGSRLPVLLGYVRLRDEPLEWLAYIINLTEQKRAARAEQKARELCARNEIVNQLAHEINNPLEALANLLYLLSTNASLDEEASAHVIYASQAAARISSIVYEVLTASQKSGAAAILQPALPVKVIL